MCVFLLSQGSFIPKLRILGQKVFPVACPQTRQTDGQTDIQRTPFQDFSNFQIVSLNLLSRGGPKDNELVEVSIPSLHTPSVVSRSYPLPQTHSLKMSVVHCVAPDSVLQV